MVGEGIVLPLEHIRRADSAMTLGAGIVVELPSLPVDK